MRSYYAQRAREYERIYDKPERQSDLALLRVYLAGRFAGRRVIDVACGTGYWSACYAGLAREIVGVDANPETLEIFATKQLANASTRVADCYQLPPDLGQFEGAFAGFWLSHVPRVRRASFFEGLHARLAPGARVVLIDNRYVAGSSTPIAGRDDAGDTWQERLLSDGSTHRVLKNFPKLEELREHVAARANSMHWWSTDYYWWFEYELAALPPLDS
jgi:demethylmenaquinone methyltransferase/2-methoxy-6-polyprenyl-1,4-benzoquinol methylase